MIESVKTLEEAEQWFMTHSSGEVLCISKNGLRRRMTKGRFMAKPVVNSKKRASAERRSRSEQRVGMRHRWKTESYRRDAIPNIGWRVLQGDGLLIMSDLTKQAAQRLAGDHNRCLPQLRVHHQSAPRYDGGSRSANSP